MADDTLTPIDEYIEAARPEVQQVLRKIRDTIRKTAPDAGEKIGYGIPTFTLHGNLVHFAAFKKHIGFFPPVRGDAALMKAVAPYANARGNLQFQLDEPIPYALITRIVKTRVADQRSRADAKKSPAKKVAAKKPAKKR